VIPLQARVARRFEDLYGDVTSSREAGRDRFGGVVD
jgi:hypothetical protein